LTVAGLLPRRERLRSSSGNARVALAPAFFCSAATSRQVQRAQVGQGGSFRLASDESTLHWLMPLVAATAIIAGAGLLLQQFPCAGRGAELRRALVTIALSIILAARCSPASAALPDITGPGRSAFATCTWRDQCDHPPRHPRRLVWSGSCSGSSSSGRTSMVIRAGVDIAHGIGARDQHPAHVRTRLRGRLGARRHQRRSAARSAIAPGVDANVLLARGRDHRRDEILSGAAIGSLLLGLDQLSTAYLPANYLL
jgi:hypothetical protein